MYIFAEALMQAVIFGSLSFAEWSVRFARILLAGDLEPNQNSEF